MKKYLLLLFLFLSFNFSYGQWIPQYHEGMVQGFSNGEIFSLPYLNVISIDTNKWRYELDYSSGLYKTAINKVTINNVPPNMFKAPLFFIANDNLGQTNANNTWTGINYFSKIVVDTLVANNIDSVHSTYWYSLSGDTIGYINAATEKVAFFKKMTIGDLHTNTTVAENFIRSNQVQTDTIYPHSPLILAGDTTIAKKIFADSIMATKFKAGNILINGGNNTISGVDSIVFRNNRSKLYESNGWVHSVSSLYVDGSGGVQSNYYKFYWNSIHPFQDSGWYFSGAKKSSIYLTTNTTVYDYANLRALRIGWTQDSVAVIKMETKGSSNYRPLVITADTVFSHLLGSKTDDIIVGATDPSAGKKIDFYIGTSARWTINNYAGGYALYPRGDNSFDIGYSSSRIRNLYLGTCLYSPTITLTNTSEPSNPSAGQIYYNSSDNHYYGYNGTIWKQLDN